MRTDPTPLEEVAARLQASLENDGVEGVIWSEAYFHKAGRPNLQEHAAKAFRVGFIIPYDGFALVRALIKEMLEREEWITILRLNMTPIPSIEKYAISIVFLLYDLSLIFKSHVALQALKDRATVTDALVTSFKALKKSVPRKMVRDINSYVSTTIWSDADEVEARVKTLSNADLLMLDDYRILVELENFERAIWESIDDWIQVEMKDAKGRHQGKCLYFPVLTDGFVQLGQDDVPDYAPGKPPKALDPKRQLEVLADKGAALSLRLAAFHALKTIISQEARDLTDRAEDEYRPELETLLDAALAESPKPTSGSPEAEAQIPDEIVYENEVHGEDNLETYNNRLALWTGEGNLYALARYSAHGHCDPKWDDLVEVGYRFYSTESWGDAIHYYEKAVSLGCRDGMVHYRLGVCIHRLFSPDEALGYFLSALTLLPERYEGVVYTLEAAKILGVMEENAGRKKEALGYYKLSVAEDMHNPYAINLRSKLEDVEWLFDADLAKLPVLEIGAISPFPIPPPPILAQLKDPKMRRKALTSVDNEWSTLKIPSQWNPVMDEMAKGILEGDRDVRWTCAMAFTTAAYQGKIKKASHINALITACEDNDRDIAGIAGRALYVAAKEGLDLSAYADTFLSNLESEYYPVACYSMATLGFIGGDLSETVGEILAFGSHTPLLRDMHLQPGDKAAVTLALLSAEPKNLEALVTAMEDGLESYMSEVYIWFVIMSHARARFDITPFYHLLVRGFESKKLKVVQGSAWAFYLAARAGRTIDAALPYLKKLLKSKRETLRTHGAIALAMNYLVNDDRKAAERLLKRKDPGIKRGAAFAFMDRCLVQEDVEGIVDLLADDEDVIWGMASALGHIDEVYFWAHEHGLKPAVEWFPLPIWFISKVSVAVQEKAAEMEAVWEKVTDPNRPSHPS